MRMFFFDPLGKLPLTTFVISPCSIHRCPRGPGCEWGRECVFYHESSASDDDRRSPSAERGRRRRSLPSPLSSRRRGRNSRSPGRSGSPSYSPRRRRRSPSPPYVVHRSRSSSSGKASTQRYRRHRSPSHNITRHARSRSPPLSLSPPRGQEKKIYGFDSEEAQRSCLNRTKCPGPEVCHWKTGRLHRVGRQTTATVAHLRAGCVWPYGC